MIQKEDRRRSRRPKLQAYPPMRMNMANAATTVTQQLPPLFQNDKRWQRLGGGGSGVGWLPSLDIMEKMPPNSQNGGGLAFFIV
jgi:hypothetical protein